jgi:hypothetical protein
MSDRDTPTPRFGDRANKGQRVQAPPITHCFTYTYQRSQTDPSTSIIGFRLFRLS